MNVTETMSNAIQKEKAMPRKACCFVDLTVKVSMSMNDKLHEENVLGTLLREEAEKQITQNGISHFYCITDCGAALCALEVVVDLKKKYPNITVEAVIPNEEQHIGWSEYTREKYFSAIALSDIENMSVYMSIEEGMYKCYKEAIQDSDSLIYIHGRYPRYQVIAFDNYTY